MYQMKNFQTSADLSKNYHSFFNITRNFDGLKATFSYLMNGHFQQIKLQAYCLLYISYCKQYFHLADNFFPGSQVPRKENIFCSSGFKTSKQWNSLSPASSADFEGILGICCLQRGSNALQIDTCIAAFTYLCCSSFMCASKIHFWKLLRAAVLSEEELAVPSENRITRIRTQEFAKLSQTELVRYSCKEKYATEREIFRLLYTVILIVDMVDNLLLLFPIFADAFAGFGWLSLVQKT